MTRSRDRLRKKVAERIVDASVHAAFVWDRQNDAKRA